MILEVYTFKQGFARLNFYTFILVFVVPQGRFVGGKASVS